MNHHCRALAISCIDFRFVSKVRKYLVDQGLEGNYDLVSLPGASLAIDEAMKAVEISNRLHQPSEVYLFDHEDCGAYGEDNSKERHISNLKKARDEILTLNPNLTVKLMLVGFERIEGID
jgi:carbonic anhydrase